MARKRKRSPRGDTSEDRQPRGGNSPRTMGADSPNFTGPASSTISVNEIAGTPIGISNVVRSFTRDSPENGPSIVWRKVTPYAAFLYGFSKTNDDASPSTDFLSPSVAPGTDFFPRTNFAYDYEFQVWPLMRNIFDSGLGARTKVTGFSNVTRTLAMTMQIYAYLRTVGVLNRLAYHQDWSEIVPFVDLVPSQIYSVAEAWDATDVDLLQTWLPLSRRFEDLVMFPNLTATIKRLTRPMFYLDLHGRLVVPTPISAFSASGTGKSIRTAIQNMLDWILVENADATNLLRTFMPFSVAQQDPWGDVGPVMDPSLHVARWNSGRVDWNTFSAPATFPEGLGNLATLSVDTGTSAWDPESPPNLNVNFHTRGAQPIWDEVGNSTVMLSSGNGTAAKKALRIATIHETSSVYMLDDADSDKDLSYDSAEEALDRYIRFQGTRFAHLSSTYKTDDATYTGAAYGMLDPGLVVAEVPYPAIRRLVRSQAETDFAARALKYVTVGLMGGSLREIRGFLAREIQSEAMK